MVRVEISERDRQKGLLSEAALGGVERIPPSLAVDLLAQLEISESERKEALQGILRNPSSEPHTKALVAHSLARLIGSAAAPDLLDLLSGPAGQSPSLAITATAALGRVGSPEHLDALRSFADSATDERTREVARFAANLVAHRHGMADQVADFPPVDVQARPQSTGAGVFRSATPGQYRRRESFEAARRELPWLSEDQDAHEIQCGRQLLTVLAPRGIASRDGIRRLAETPSVAGVLTVRKESTEESYASMLVLTHPTPSGSVAMMICRLKGEAYLVGEGTVAHDEAVFELVSVEAPGVPAISVRIRLEHDRVEITGTSSGQKVAGREPQQVAEDEGL